MLTDSGPRSRRSILAGALGAAGGAVAMALGRPLSANATVATMQTGTDNTSDAPTRLLRSSPGFVLGVAPSTMPAYEIGGETVAIGTDVMGAPALNVVSSNDEFALGMQVSAPGDLSTGIKVAASQVGIRAEVHNEFGAGLQGIAQGSEAAGVSGLGEGYGTAGVTGVSSGPAGTGVIGNAVGSGTGGSFRSDTGSALQVNGRARFTRSGRASVPKSRSYVDITVPGGLSTTTSSILATIQTYRSGVSVAGVRLNYPSAGKARIYLTHIASTTATTPVGWFVIG
jgi:hypothetical protein